MLKLTRRSVTLGSLAAFGGCAFAKNAQETVVRADLYNGQLDHLALQWTGRREQIPAHIRIASRQETGEPMSIRGRVLSWETGLPVVGVVVYAYHTDRSGVYTPKSQDHARLHGWMRTGGDGTYAFDSTKPGRYPDGNEASHIHLTVAEPERRPYWIDNIVFDGEQGVDRAYRARVGNRGGSGIIMLRRQSGVWIGVRDIRLERHPA